MKSTAQAIALLREHADFRTFKSILLNADPEQLPEKELRAKIVAGMCLNHPDKQPDSIKRTVSNWFADRIRTIGRDTAFELCLILKLPLEDANRLMMQITGEAIHWRNPEEIVWGYAISHQLGYEETRRLLNTAALLFSSGSGDHRPDVFTHMVRAEVLEHLAGTPDDLIAYIAGNMEKWSAYHNSAYDLFMRYMQLLQTATPDQDEFEARKADFEKEKKAGRTEAEMDDAMTVDTILDTYFFRRIIGMDGEMDSLQRSIRMYWPDESTLSKMKRRSADVSRKTLILLFLATNGSATEYQTDEDEELDERQSRDKVFRSIYIRLNRMLSRCGFQPLDPRSPFDWMVIFCICVEDIWDTDRRLTTVLEGLFPGSEEHTGNR